MVMLATLRRSGGIEALARKLDVAPSVAALGIAVLLPVVLGGFRRVYESGADPTVESGGGVAALVARLAPYGGGDMALSIMVEQGPVEAKAQALLGDLFSAATIARIIEHGVNDTGLSRDLVAGLLPMLTMLVGGYLGARVDALMPDASAAVSRVLADELTLTLGLDLPVNPLNALTRPD